MMSQDPDMMLRDDHTTTPGSAISNDNLQSPLNHHGPGPELDSSDKEMQRLSMLNSQSAYLTGINNNTMVRTSEPDNDACMQPEQRRRSQTDAMMMMMNNNNCMAGDNMSQVTGTDTLDTEKTLQIGSLSKKPSPDDPGFRPVVRKPTPPHQDPAYALHQQGVQLLGQLDGFVNNNNNNNNDREASLLRLSFPSPPSVQDEEAPTRETNSIQGENLDTNNNPEHQKDDNSSSSSSTLSSEDDDKQEGIQKCWIVGVIVVVLVIILAIILGVTIPKNDSNNESTAVDNPTDAPTAMEPSISSQQPVPTLAPSDGIIDVDDGYDDNEGESAGIILTSGELDFGNNETTGENNVSSNIFSHNETTFWNETN